MNRISAMIRVGVLAAALSCKATVALATTVIFDFAGIVAPNSSKVFTVGEITVTAESANLRFGEFFLGGSVTQSGVGLGVGGAGLVIDTNAEVDGFLFDDVLILTFDRLVSNVSTLFRGIDLNGSDDWDVFVDDGSGAFVKILDDGTMPVFLAAGPVQRIAYLADDDNDDFRVGAVSVETTVPVPLPAAGWLMLAACGSLAFLRRKTSAV